MFLKQFSFAPASDPRVSQPLCTKQKKSRIRQRFDSTIVCLHIRQSSGDLPRFPRRCPTTAASESRSPLAEGTIVIGAILIA